MLQPSATHVNVVIPPLAQPLLYRVPDSHTTKPGIGARVEVPLGSRVVMGFVVSLAHEAEAQTVGPNVKDIEAETAHQAFHPEQLDFFRRIADYYGEVLSNVIDTAIPTPVSARFKKTVSLAAASNKELRGKLERAIVAKLSASGSQALDYSVLLKQIRGAGPALKRLAQRGLVNIAQEELAAADPSLSIPDWARTEVTLNEAQRAAVGFLSDLIRKRQFSTVLLHGVTGSGKTEVYIRAIQTAQALGLGALVIVP